MKARRSWWRTLPYPTEPGSGNSTQVPSRHPVGPLADTKSSDAIYASSLHRESCKNKTSRDVPNTWLKQTGWLSCGCCATAKAFNPHFRQVASLGCGPARRICNHRACLPRPSLCCLRRHLACLGKRSNSWPPQGSCTDLRVVCT